MPEGVVYYVTRYGYLAIFILVFLQEIGMPNLFPNELLLMFSGYLSFKGVLFLPFIILIAVFADFIGTSILYFLFYNTGTYLIQKKPKWLPLSSRMIDQLTSKISKGGHLSIYIFRITPFTRGYASVITGLLHVEPRVYLPITLISGITWAAIYVLIGHLMGPSWNLVTQNIGSFKWIILTVLTIVFCVVLLVYINRANDSNKAKTGIIKS